MVDAILDAIEQELGEEINVVLTGGDASAIAPLLRRSCKIDSLLTLRGIAFAAGKQL
jgi:type III pantothenate kinase